MNQVRLDLTAGKHTHLFAAGSRLLCWPTQSPRIARLWDESFHVRLAPFARLLREEDGQDLIEYAFIVALVALGALASVSGMAGKLRNALATVGSAVTSAT